MLTRGHSSASRVAGPFFLFILSQVNQHKDHETSDMSSVSVEGAKRAPISKFDATYFSRSLRSTLKTFSLRTLIRLWVHLKLFFLPALRWTKFLPSCCAECFLVPQTEKWVRTLDCAGPGTFMMGTAFGTKEFRCDKQEIHKTRSWWHLQVKRNKLGLWGEHSYPEHSRCYIHAPL